MNPDTLRAVVALLGILAFGLLVWRLVGWWTRLTVLEHAAVGLLALGVLLSAFAGAKLILLDGAPANPWLYPIALHRLGCIILAVFWRRWLGRRHSPFRRGPSPAAG